jgi:hypothetical protein
VSTEVWFRNPDTYIRELVECGVFQIAWDRGYLVKRKVDPIKHAELYYGQAYPWRVLAIGPQGSAEYRAATSGTEARRSIRPGATVRIRTFSST